MELFTTRKDIFQRVKVKLSVGSRSPKTIKTYTSIINSYLTYLSKKGIYLDDTNYGTVEEFMFYYMDGKASDRTKVMIKTVMFFLYRLILNDKDIAMDIKDLIKSPKIRKTEVEALDPDQIKKILSHTNPHDYLMFLTQYICGLRVEELSLLTIEQVRKKQIVGKGSKKRDIYLPDQHQKILQEYYDKTHANPLFSYSTSNIQRRFKKYVILAGMDAVKVTPHILRKSFTNNMINKGHSIDEVADYLGHESIDTTRNHYKDKSKIRRNQNE
ncbi:MAG: tyrosine-type recombinase/integrase [Candidatus Daviesbacteria bacterium]|nr:tyrosine-type recombinase/integrase [Candidatus Daviesbacteria bacterium]